MRSPTIAAPAMRGIARSQQTTGVTQSFNIDCIIRCGAQIIRCASQCIPNPLNPGCISCLGSSWNTCKNCF